MREHQIVITLKPDQFLRVQKLARSAGAKSMGMFVRQQLLAALGIDGQAGAANSQMQVEPMVNELKRLHGELRTIVAESLAAFSEESDAADVVEAPAGLPFPGKQAAEANQTQVSSDAADDPLEETAARTFAISPQLGILGDAALQVVVASGAAAVQAQDLASDRQQDQAPDPAQIQAHTHVQDPDDDDEYVPLSRKLARAQHLQNAGPQPAAENVAANFEAQAAEKVPEEQAASLAQSILAAGEDDGFDPFKYDNDQTSDRQSLAASPGMPAAGQLASTVAQINPYAGERPDWYAAQGAGAEEEIYAESAMQQNSNAAPPAVPPYVPAASLPGSAATTSSYTGLTAPDPMVLDSNSSDSTARDSAAPDPTAPDSTASGSTASGSTSLSDPAAWNSTAADPTTSNSTASDPAAWNSTTSDSTASDPTAWNSTAADPITSDPITSDPTSSDSTAPDSEAAGPSAPAPVWTVPAMSAEEFLKSHGVLFQNQASPSQPVQNQPVYESRDPLSELLGPEIASERETRKEPYQMPHSEEDDAYDVPLAILARRQLLANQVRSLEDKEDFRRTEILAENERKSENSTQQDPPAKPDKPQLSSDQSDAGQEVVPPPKKPESSSGQGSSGFLSARKPLGNSDEDSPFSGGPPPKRRQ